MHTVGAAAHTGERLTVPAADRWIARRGVAAAVAEVTGLWSPRAAGRLAGLLGFS